MLFQLLCRAVAIAITIVALSGCGAPSPSGPDFSHNAGVITANITSGSASPVGTAKCGVLAAPQKGTALSAPSADCSDATAEPFFAPAEPE